MSKTKLLALFVEGNDDDRFVKRIVIPRLPCQYTGFAMKYAEEPPEKVNDFIESICRAGGDYLLLSDADDASCITEKKDQLLVTYPALSHERIVVVAAEIESWYYAGLPSGKPPALRGLQQHNTDGLTKEQLTAMKPRAIRSRVDFLIELLKVFSFDDAKQRNTSFNYMCTKHSVSI